MRLRADHADVPRRWFSVGQKDSYRWAAGIFATLDAGAPRTVGVYFMYDVKQVNPAEWSSPPFDAYWSISPASAKLLSDAAQSTKRAPSLCFSPLSTPFKAQGANFL